MEILQRIEAGLLGGMERRHFPVTARAPQKNSRVLQRFIEPYSVFSLTDLVAILGDRSLDNLLGLKRHLSAGHLEGNNEIVVAQQDVEVFALFRHVV
ncbi:hypothetical protein [Shinella kummerowiae]|uniref:hypothetical protein n=1 Tax=Shinella kummerowiae TaxID=417745 RepID=UPI0021B53DC5|nr:hypothetical protein [Shinella kummerowiae]MCT7665491.1 hypothetical protein [Shinella kummerowiae]